MTAFTHHIAVRYGECDQQGVVFNANYLAYVDDAMDHWMRSLVDTTAVAPAGPAVADAWTDTWDVMLKRAVVTWLSPARWPETVAVECGIGRWGTTSFDAVFRLRVDDRPVADVVITYVSIERGSNEPIPTPPRVRAALGELVPLPA